MNLCKNIVYLVIQSCNCVDLHLIDNLAIIDFKILVLTYKSLHQQTPDYLANLLHVQTGRRCLRSTSSAPHLVEPRTHLITFADRAFSSYAPRQWNRLPDHIRNADSINIFKRLLKCHLFEHAFVK